MSSLTAVETFLREPRNVIVAGIRKDGRPHLSPNWYHYDGEKFYISTTRLRAKYRIFRRDPRAELLFDQPSPQRYVSIPATVEIREDLSATLGYFRTIRETYRGEFPTDEELTAQLLADERVMLVLTPAPRPDWTFLGFS